MSPSNLMIFLNKMKTISQIILFLIPFCCLNLAAADSDKYDEKTDAGLEAVVATSEKLKSPPPARKAKLAKDSIINSIAERMKAAGVKKRWDDSKDRYANVVSYKLKVDPNVDLEKYMALRQIASYGALLLAQADLAKWIGTEADISVAMNNPGDPFSKDRFNAKLKEEAESKLKAVRSKLDALGVQLDKAEKSQLEGVTLPDRIVSATDAVIKKLDANYDSGKIAEDKKARVSELKADMAEVNAKVAELNDQYIKYQNAYNEGLDSKIAMTYDHVIFGLSAVDWQENLDKGWLEVGLGFVWSPKLAKAVHSALIGDPGYSKEEVKGDASLDDWIDKQDPSTIGAFRFYIDNQGDRWFIGTAAAANSNRHAQTIAKLRSIAMLYLPLYSSLIGETSLVETMRTGEMPADVVTGLLQKLQASTKANTRGMSQNSYDVDWAVKTSNGNEGEESVNVAVSYLNARAAAAALKASVQMALSSAAVERENNRRKLEQAQLLGIVKKAKTETPASRVPGLVSESSTPKKKPTPAVGETDNEKAKGKNSPLPGKRASDEKIQDDF